jgi:hypothetical protein
MGTTLTGTTPQDTYDSLIKVTDNGPLSGSLKTLTDGLGNDSALALSTGAASITGTLAVSSNLTVDTNTLFVDATNNRVGVGTITPNAPIQINGVPLESSPARATIRTFDTSSPAASVGAGMMLGYQYDTAQYVDGACIQAVKENATLGNYATALSFLNRANGLSFSEKMRITSAGNVGIGTSTPQSTLDVRKLSTNLGTTSELGLLISNTGVLGQYAQIGFGYSESTCAAVIAGVITSPSGATTSNLVFATRSGTGGATAPVERMRVTADGLTFNGDTAAANALDDYEEGTWTMGIAFNNGATGVTYSSNTGRYTKIGRQVSVVGYLALTNKGSSTGNATITGLPFTIGAGASNYSAASISNLANVTFADFPQLRGEIGTTNILFLETSNAGALSALSDGDFANNSEVMISFTYFV